MKNNVDIKINLKIGTSKQLTLQQSQNLTKLLKGYINKKNTKKILFVITVIKMMQICCGKQIFNLFVIILNKNQFLAFKIAF